MRAPHNGLALRKWAIRRLTEDDFLDVYDPGKIKFPIRKSNFLSEPFILLAECVSCTKASNFNLGKRDRI